MNLLTSALVPICKTKCTFWQLKECNGTFFCCCKKEILIFVHKSLKDAGRVCIWAKTNMCSEGFVVILLYDRIYFIWSGSSLICALAKNSQVCSACSSNAFRHNEHSKKDPKSTRTLIWKIYFKTADIQSAYLLSTLNDVSWSIFLKLVY